MKTSGIVFIIFLLVLKTTVFAQTNITIGTVNNSDMIILQKLSREFVKQHPDIQLNWVVLEENILRQQVTADISTNGGKFDIITIGAYETPIWAKQGWLKPLNKFPEDYDVGDFVEVVRKSLSYGGTLYALPFYSESSMTFYRKDLFQEKGLVMPEQPTYQEVYRFASVLHQPDMNRYGVCLRGKAGWGENGAFLTSLVNSFGGRWFDMEWKPQLTSPEWKNAISFYVDLLQNFGPPGAAHNGHNENRALFANGHCAIWIDATVVAGFLSHPEKSVVSQTIGFAKAPEAQPNTGNTWLWSWALAIPASCKASDAAQKFILWATSKEYIKLAGEREGWLLVPPGTRKSTYSNPKYREVADRFSNLVLKTIEATNYKHSSLRFTPYHRGQFVQIPEFQNIGNQVGLALAGALVGKISVEQALEQAQRSTEQIMREAGYYHTD